MQITFFAKLILLPPLDFDKASNIKGAIVSANRKIFMNTPLKTCTNDKSCAFRLCLIDLEFLQ